MGVIKKLLFRDEMLSAPRHRNIFLDMEENIHIHYRDIRIELSRGEFEEFSNAFVKQSAELRAIIDSTNYQDGKLPNANRDDVRIWLDSRLSHPVCYHPHRISIEECTDGYHLHYRNYKILIDREDFIGLQRAFGSVDVNGGYARSYQEILHLIDVNDIDFSLGSGNVPGQVLSLLVARHHYRKVQEILSAIGLVPIPKATPPSFSGAEIPVQLTMDTARNAEAFRRLRARRRARLLADFLTEEGIRMDPTLLNRIKCDVLELYGRLKAGESVHVDINPDVWMFEPDSGELVFPYSTVPACGAGDADVLYRQWSALLSRTGLGFIKPAKKVLDAEAQKALSATVRQTLLDEVATVPTVNRIYLMGSAMRGEMGVYLAPFIHGRSGKIGSDVDILIELDAALERVPDGWKFINHSSTNECDVYHVLQIPLAGDAAAVLRARYPHVEFFEHLVDAYVHVPSEGDKGKKDAFVSRFKGELLYDRERDGARNPADTAAVQTFIAETYGWNGFAVQRMDVATRNEVFWVRHGNEFHALKRFVVSGNYSSERIEEHTRYECALMDALGGRGVRGASVMQALDGRAVVPFDGVPAVMSGFLPGKHLKRPPTYPLAAIAEAIAAFQSAQASPLNVEVAFDFRETCRMWLDAFVTYRAHPDLPPVIRQDFESLVSMFDALGGDSVLEGMNSRTERLHCHGDLSPKNVLLNPDGSVSLFDFNNAFYGPRLVDPLDAAFELSLGGKYVREADFARFTTFLQSYTALRPFSADEYADWPLWRGLIGIIKFVKEVRARFESGGQATLRDQRAHLIAAFLRAQGA